MAHGPQVKSALERLAVLALACEDPHTWAAYWKQLRADMQWSQTDLAARLGITAGAVAHYEGGRRIPGRDVCRKLGSLLTQEAGLSPDQDPFTLEDTP